MSPAAAAQAAPADAAPIRLAGITKRFGAQAALRGVDLVVPRGSIFGFLGPNGAGKTTTLRILMGLIRANDGSAELLGLDPWTDRVELHERIGYLPGGMGFYEHMTGRELLDYCASLLRGPGRGSPLRALALDALALSDTDLRRPISTYSKGMRQKLAIVQAVQHDPELLLLDEPSEGLDPLVQHEFADLLRGRRDVGRTIFFSSHTLSEVQSLCDHVAIIREGAVVASATYEELTERHPRVVRISGLRGDVQALVERDPQWWLVSQDGEALVLHTTAPPTEVVRTLAGFEFDDVTIEPASLEDVFLGYYGGEETE